MTKVFISRSHFDAHVVAYLNHSTVYADKARFPLAPRTVDVSSITEYGLTQKLSNSIRCF